MSNYKTQTRQIIRMIQGQVKGWGTNRIPSPSELAPHIKDWRNSLEHLKAYDQMQVPSFEKAVQSMDSAWSNRAQTKSAVKDIQDSLSYLKMAEDECEGDPAVQSAKTYKSVKSTQRLFGDQDESPKSIPPAMKSLHTTKTILGTRLMSPQFDENDSIRIRQSIKTLQMIDSTYPEDTRVLESSRRARNYLTLAYNELNSGNQNKARARMKSALQVIDDVGAAIASRTMSTSRVPLDSQDLYEMKKQAEGIRNALARYEFEIPQRVFSVAQKSAQLLLEKTSEHTDNVARRYAETIDDTLRDALSISRRPYVKSGGLESWDDPEIDIFINKALSAVDKFNEYIGNIHRS